MSDNKKNTYTPKPDDQSQKRPEMPFSDRNKSESERLNEVMQTQPAPRRRNDDQSGKDD